MAVALASFAFSSGCTPRADARFATPEATVRSLFAAYAVSQASESDVRARLAARERFHLRDRTLYRSCFADFDREEDEGAAGFVFGRLVAVKEHLVFHTAGDRATVRATADATPIPTVHLRKIRGGYRIVLRESVPPEVRAQLRAVWRRQREHLERQGLGSR